MKQQDLMLDDWVHCTRSNEPVRVVRLSELFASIGVFDNKVLCDIMSYEPIPLTKEILEQNGFTEGSPYCWDYIEGNKKVIAESNEIFTNAATKWTVRVEIDYEAIAFADLDSVHELQHVLRMGGVDKQINL